MCKGRGLCRTQGDLSCMKKLAQGVAPQPLRVTTPNDVQYILNIKHEYCTVYYDI